MQAEGFNLFRGEIWMVHPDGLCTQTCLAMLVAASYPSLYEPTFYLCPSLKGMSDEIYCPLIVRSETRCVSAPQRAFVPLEANKYSGLLTPWMFCNYDSSTPPSPTVRVVNRQFFQGPVNQDSLSQRLGRGSPSS